MTKKRSKTVVYWRVGDKILATTQRVASASMAEALGPAGTRPEVKRISQSDAFLLRQAEGFEIIMWIREPLDRLACAYPIWRSGKYGSLSPTAFAAKVQRGGNVHFDPQVSLHWISGIGFLPTRLYAYADMAETWGHEFGKYPLPWIGEQPQRMKTEEFISQLSDEAKNNMDMLYARDARYHFVAINHPGVKITDWELDDIDPTCNGLLPNVA